MQRHSTRDTSKFTLLTWWCSYLSLKWLFAYFKRKMSYILLLYPPNNEVIPPNNEVVGGYIGFTPSVRLSRLPCPLCNIYSSGWILSILATNDHYQERVCRTQWPLTLTYIFKVIWPWLRKWCPLCSIYSSGARPTNDISIEFEIWPKFAMLLFNTYSADHNDILHTSRQLHCRRVQNFVAISGAYFKLEHCEIWSNFEFDRITFSGTGAWMDSFYIWHKWSLSFEGVSRVSFFSESENLNFWQTF